MNTVKLEEMLKVFFMEDIGERDMTSTALFEGNEAGEFHFIAKSNGVFCGTEVIIRGFRMLDGQAEFRFHVRDGEPVESGQPIVDIQGVIPALLMGERVILNLIQRMSGIATMAHNAAAILQGTSTKPCDTRKTAPGLRMLEKYAVACGGASNHRFGLYDGVMIKDNHIAFMGGIAAAVQKAKQANGHMVKIEVETSTKEQVVEAVEAGADIIMFDNCTPEQVAEFVKLVPVHCVTEASGGITLDNLAAYRECGVDYISLGCLTHSVKALDISAKVNMLEGQ
ncbi:carboxylating nicotinate-nucleotide diphosphorylase [Bacillus sp. 1P06AnD]|uniref:carboxylating nicotinate-nucleotide diphosphorylase n=1 Tax=Bacillus sp. 1P06AnD TaxID=3132208 RepID=UPI0039A05248